MTAAIKTKKAPPRLWVKTIGPRTWHVECASREHHYHQVVRSLSSGSLVCDQACWKFRRSYTCTHTDAVHSELYPGPVITPLTPFELWAGDEYSTLEAGDGPIYDGSSCCGCMGPAGEMYGCSCPCHSVVPVPPPVKKLTLEDVFADYA